MGGEGDTFFALNRGPFFGATPETSANILGCIENKKP